MRIVPFLIRLCVASERLSSYETTNEHKIQDKWKSTIKSTLEHIAKLPVRMPNNCDFYSIAAQSF